MEMFLCRWFRQTKKWTTGRTECFWEVDSEGEQVVMCVELIFARELSKACWYRSSLFQ